MYPIPVNTGEAEGWKVNLLSSEDDLVPMTWHRMVRSSRRGRVQIRSKASESEMFPNSTLRALRAGEKLRKGINVFIDSGKPLAALLTSKMTTFKNARIRPPALASAALMNRRQLTVKERVCYPGELAGSGVLFHTSRFSRDLDLIRNKRRTRARI